MSDQRIDTAAAAAAGADADPMESGQGLASEEAHPGGLAGGSTGDPEDLRAPGEERGDIGEPAEGDTEGERAVRRMTGQAPDQTGTGAGSGGV